MSYKIDFNLTDDGRYKDAFVVNPATACRWIIESHVQISVVHRCILRISSEIPPGIDDSGYIRDSTRFRNRVSQSHVAVHGNNFPIQERNTSDPFLLPGNWLRSNRWQKTWKYPISETQQSGRDRCPRRTSLAHPDSSSGLVWPAKDSRFDLH